jgi:hypothetical protein
MARYRYSGLVQIEPKKPVFALAPTPLYFLQQVGARQILARNTT